MKLKEAKVQEKAEASSSSKAEMKPGETLSADVKTDEKKESKDTLKTEAPASDKPNASKNLAEAGNKEAEKKANLEKSDKSKS